MGRQGLRAFWRAHFDLAGRVLHLHRLSIGTGTRTTTVAGTVDQGLALGTELAVERGYRARP